MIEKAATVVSRLTPSGKDAAEAMDTTQTPSWFLTPSCYDSLSLKLGAALIVFGSALCETGEE